MNFDWEGYLRVAREFERLAQGHRDSEAFYRSAISRAYYAAYITARRYLEHTERMVIADHRSHRQVSQTFLDLSRNPQYPSLSGLFFRVHKELARLVRRRVWADYEDNYVDPIIPRLTLREACKESLDRAQRVLSNIAKIRDLRPEP